MSATISKIASKSEIRNILSSLFKLIRNLLQSSFKHMIILCKEEKTIRAFRAIPGILSPVTQPKGGLRGSIPPGSFKYLEGSTGRLLVASQKVSFLYGDPPKKIFGCVPVSQRNSDWSYRVKLRLIFDKNTAYQNTVHLLSWIF